MTITEPTSTAPTSTAPRRRPKDRRQQILTAAAGLFERSGYDGVSMADIAAAVDVTPRAIYRHFTSKTEVLQHCLDAALNTVEDALRDRDADQVDPDGIDTILVALAGIPAANYLGLMWTRDANGLPEHTSRQINDRFDRIAEQIAAALACDRPDLAEPEVRLVTWSLVAVFTSVSLYRVRLSDPELRALLLRVSQAVAGCPLSTQPEPPAPPSGPGIPRAARRAQLLQAAGELFAENGYPAVSMDDIGARAGVSAAMVYQYFENKAAILWAVQVHGNEILEALLTHDFRAASSPADALQRLLRSYTKFSIEYPHVIRNLTAGLPHLNPEQREQARRGSHDYLHEWITLVRHAEPGVDEEHARSGVHAAMSVIHTAVRTPDLINQPTLAENLCRLGASIFNALGPPTRRSAAPQPGD